MAEKPIVDIKAITDERLKEILNNPTKAQQKLLSKVFKAKAKTKKAEEKEEPLPRRVYIVSIPCKCELCGDETPVEVKSNVANPDTLVAIRKFWCGRCEDTLKELPPYKITEKLMQIARILWPDNIRRA